MVGFFTTPTALFINVDKIEAATAEQTAGSAFLNPVRSKGKKEEPCQLIAVESNRFSLLLHVRSLSA